MRALRWIIVTLAVVVVLIIVGIAVGAAWLNSYIHSDAFKVEVEARAGRTLGGTVQIQTVDFDIFHGVKLQGLVTQLDPGHVNGQGALMVKVGSVNCTYAWTELLSRRLKLTGVTLDKPEIILTREATEPAPPQVRPGAADSGAAQGEGTAMPFQFSLDRAKINDGAVSVRDAAGVSLVELHGINASADTAGYYDGRDVTGTVRIADLLLPSNLHVTDFSTPFAYGRGTLDAKSFEAAAFNGRVAGDYQLGTSGPSILNLNGKGFDLAQLTAATTSGSSAKLTGRLDLQSKWRGVETGDVNGEGDAQVADGKIEGVKILQELSQVLKVKELDAPVITKGQTHFLVANRQTQLTGLQLESPIFSMTGDGVIAFDGGLNMNLVLVLTRDSMTKIPKQIAASFVQQADGTGSIAFHVTGTTANPQTDLAMRLLMQNTQIKNVINKALNKFFH